MKNIKTLLLIVAVALTVAACKEDKPIEVETITLSAETLALNEGESITLTATVAPAEARYTLTWKSSEGSVATVDANGTVTAVAAGTTIITAVAPNGTKITCTVTVGNAPAKGWVLEWEESFNKDDVIDDAVWSKIPRDSPAWQCHMSNYDALFDVKDGNLILRGMVNPGPPAVPTDTKPFLTGGIYTKFKKTFYRGKLEIRAKLGNAQGAWPAIWLMPHYDAEWPWAAWPKGGEIDIMERLNYNEVVHQTVHSHYTQTLKQYRPLQSKTTSFVNNEYNVYGVALYADSVVFSINGKHTLTYPRIETTLEGQFPFDRPQYLKLSMQLGGDWAGAVEPKDLPVEMLIDWVRFYKWKN